jgi:hypothetical protein
MSEDSEDTDDTTTLGELSQQLTAIDVDASRADRIAFQARGTLGRGPSLLRFGEPVLVTIFTASFLVWALMKVIEVFS